MSTRNIHLVIRDLNDHLLDLPDDRARQFIKEMHCQLERDGDLFCGSYRQIKFIRALEARLTRRRKATSETVAVVAEEKPLTGLAALKAKKAKLFKAIAQREKVEREKHVAIMQAHRELREEEPVNARMRHRRSICSQLAHSPLLKTQTKR